MEENQRKWSRQCDLYSSLEDLNAVRKLRNGIVQNEHSNKKFKMDTYCPNDQTKKIFQQRGIYWNLVWKGIKERWKTFYTKIVNAIGPV